MKPSGSRPAVIFARPAGLFRRLRQISYRVTHQRTVWVHPTNDSAQICASKVKITSYRSSALMKFVNQDRHAESPDRLKLAVLPALEWKRRRRPQPLSMRGKYGRWKNSFVATISQPCHRRGTTVNARCQRHKGARCPQLAAIGILSLPPFRISASVPHGRLRRGTSCCNRQ